MSTISTIKKQYADLIIERKRLISESNKIQKKYDDEIGSVCSQIRSFVIQPKLQQLLNLLIQSRPELSYSESTGLISINSQTPAYDYTKDNYAEAARITVSNIISSVKNLSDRQKILELCASYNTLIGIFRSADKIKSALVDENIRSIKSKMAGIDAETEALYRTITEENTESAGYGEGNIVYGFIDNNFTQEEITALAEAGIKAEKLSRLVLKAEKHSNSAIINADTNNNSNVIYQYVSSVFFRNIEQYASGDFSVAFIENENYEHRPLFNFISFLLNAKQRYPLFNPCLYKTTVQEEDAEYRNASIQNGLAKDAASAAMLLEDIVTELNSRKISDGIKEFNQENPYNHQQYIFLVINGLVGFTEEGQIRPKVINNLELLLDQGGQYGIYVLLLGKSDTYGIHGQYGKEWTFDAQKFDTKETDMNVLDAEEMLLDGTGIEQALKERADFDKDSNFLTLRSLLSRQDINIPEAESEITIPVGVCDNNIYYYATSSDESKSTLKGGNSSLIIGGTGKGKTAFLRSLILSGAWHYSPDDLLFYILDFKTVEDNSAADFRMFEKCTNSSDSGYLQIPHVRFLAMGGNVQSGAETIDMIEGIVSERGRIFSKYRKDNEIKDCVQYRHLLHEKMKAAGTADYVSYRNIAGKDAMPSMPQIYFLIDEYGSVFSDNKLRKRLDNTVRTVRSYGISIMLSGQNNILENEILANIPNRISFDSSDYYVFRSVLSDDSDRNEKAVLSRLFRKINGKVGHAVCKYNPHLEGKFVKMAYLGDKEEPGEIAREIREKYSDKYYDVIQQKSGNRDKVNADSIAPMLNNTPDCFAQPITGVRLYVGLTVMTSDPEAIRFENAASTDGISKNCIVETNSEKQNTIMLNSMIYFAMLTKRIKAANGMQRISFNYNRESIQGVGFNGEIIKENVFNSTSAMIQKRQLSNLIAVNNTPETIISEINRVYALLQDRKHRTAADNLPYLIVLQNANWLSDFNEIQEEIRTSDSVPQFTLKENDSVEAYCETNRKYSLVSDWTDEKIKSLYSGTPKMLYTVMKKAFEGKQADKAKTDADNRFNSIKPLSKIEEILKEGCTYNIFMLFGTDNPRMLNPSRFFMKLDDWENRITGKKENQSNSNNNAGTDEKNGTCILNGKEIRLLDYTESEQFWNYFNEQTAEV